MEIQIKDQDLRKKLKILHLKLNNAARVNCNQYLEWPKINTKVIQTNEGRTYEPLSKKNKMELESTLNYFFKNTMINTILELIMP